MLLKTLRFILPKRRFKILGAGRTDAKVSALGAAFELFLEKGPIHDFDAFLELFNKNLPPDIRALKMQEVGETFNIIKTPKLKEYVYLFSFGEKNHPFCAPFITNILEVLDLELMKKGAKLFVGTHDFSTYTVKSQRDSNKKRTVESCEIKENTLISASFFPKNSYAFHVEGKGFIRYQIRMMMGALIQLGKGELTFADIENSLTENNPVQLTYVAPGSGLILDRLDLD